VSSPCGTWLDTYYALRIHASCLKDPSVVATLIANRPQLAEA